MRLISLKWKASPGEKWVAILSFYYPAVGWNPEFSIEVEITQAANGYCCILRGARTLILQSRNPIKVEGRWSLVRQGEKEIASQSRDVTGRHRSKKHAQTSLLCYILHEGQEFFIGLREQSWYFWSHRAHLLHVGIWLIWVALLPSERAGFDLAEHKTGLTSMPVRLWWLSSGFLLWFQLSQPNLWPAMSVLYQWHTSVGSSWPEYTLVSESTFPLCNLRWALLPAACACFASLLCIGQSYFKLVAFANHYVKRSVLISGPLWAAKMSVLLGARRWHLVTFCQVTCLTAVLGCAFPATGLTTIMKPITVTGN